MDDVFSFRKTHVGRALGRTFWLFEQRVLHGLHSRGFDDFRMADAQVIRCLPLRGGARVVELAERAQITKQGMSKLVDSMEERGYLKRTPDPQDGRAQRVMLTRGGRALLKAAAEVFAELEQEWAAVVGEHALRRLKRDLFKIADELGPPDYL